MDNRQNRSRGAVARRTLVPWRTLAAWRMLVARGTRRLTPGR